MDLRRLEIFAKVAELGSFSRAAEALFLTQPTVSEHVRSLEDELGVQLLDRLGRGATPTRAGQVLLGYARRIVALAREAQQAVDELLLSKIRLAVIGSMDKCDSFMIYFCFIFIGYPHSIVSFVWIFKSTFHIHF
jgi:DNA-binding transcriptional LysR family regulator